MKADAGSDSEVLVRASEAPVSRLAPCMGPRVGGLQPRPDALNIRRRGSLQIK